jgi:phytoene synthase
VTRQYDEVAQAASKLLTQRYSSSFSSAARLFPRQVAAAIYNLYGLVRMADEIVDTYRGPDAPQLLDGLEDETYAAMDRGFSSDLVVHAFMLTARRYGIDRQLLAPFFASMRMDLQPQHYDQKSYERYIYGSAEVIGLMCLRIFCDGDSAAYEHLAPGAQRLGAAYQKINFLRDYAADSTELGRVYFPGVEKTGLTDQAKAAIIKDIRDDLALAEPALRTLPRAVRQAVYLSYRYYGELLDRLEKAPAAHISVRRLRLSAGHKLTILAATRLRPVR